MDLDGNIRRAALQAFIAAWRDDPDVLVLLQDRATVDAHWDVRRVAVEALAAEPGTLPLLLERAADDSWEVREAAIRALANGWHDHPSVLSLLHDRATSGE